MSATGSGSDELVLQLFAGDGLSESAQTLFNSYDADKSGSLNNDEATACLMALCRTVGRTVTAEHVQLLIDDNDVDNDGSLSLAEFVNVLQDCLFGPSEEQLQEQRRASAQSQLTDEQEIALARQQAWSGRFDAMMQLARAYAAVADAVARADNDEARTAAKQAGASLGKFVRALHNNALVTTHPDFFALQQQLINVTVDLQSSSRSLLSALRRRRADSVALLSRGVQAAIVHLVALADSVRLFDQQQLAAAGRETVVYTPAQRAAIVQAKQLFLLACRLLDAAVAERDPDTATKSASMLRLPSLSSLVIPPDADSLSFDDLLQRFHDVVASLDADTDLSSSSSSKASFVKAWKRACRRYEVKLEAYRLSRTPRFSVLFTARWKFFLSINGNLLKLLEQSPRFAVTFDIDDIFATSSSDTAASAPAAPLRRDLSEHEVAQLTLLQRAVRRWLMRKNLAALVLDYAKSDAARKGRNRARNLQEIVDSERRYVRDNLQVLVRDWPPALSEQLPAVQPALVDMLAINEALLARLEQRMSEWPSNQLFADVLLDVLPQLRVYAVYANDYENALAAVTELRAAANQLHPLEHVLITPIQRVMRYPMLLGELKKLTPVDHCDYANIEMATELATQLAHHLDATQAEAKTARQLLQLQARIQRVPVSLRTPGRRIVKEGRLKVSVNGKLAAYNNVVLFNDAILRYRQVSGYSHGQFLSIHHIDDGMSFEDGSARKSKLPDIKIIVNNGETVLAISAPDRLTRETWANELRSQIKLRWLDRLRATTEFD